MSDYDSLDAREVARARRRDHDLSAPARAGMRSGLAKGFKQILDARVKRDVETLAKEQRRQQRGKR